MGLISFLADAGMKVFGPDTSKATEPAKTIREHLAENGVDVTHIKTRFDGKRVVLDGHVASAAAREKAVLVAGNVQGVEEVDDRLEVGDPTADAAAVAAAPAAPGPLGALAAAIQAGAVAAVEGWSSVTYTVKKGDTLSGIAKTVYGKASKYPVIFEANRPMLSDPDKIYPGQVLRIPPLED